MSELSFSETVTFDGNNLVYVQKVYKNGTLNESTAVTAFETTFLIWSILGSFILLWKCLSSSIKYFFPKKTYASSNSSSNSSFNSSSNVSEEILEKKVKIVQRLLQHIFSCRVGMKCPDDSCVEAKLVLYEFWCKYDVIDPIEAGDSYSSDDSSDSDDKSKSDNSRDSDDSSSDSNDSSNSDDSSESCTYKDSSDSISVHSFECGNDNQKPKGSSEKLVSNHEKDVEPPHTEVVSSELTGVGDDGDVDTTKNIVNSSAKSISYKRSFPQRSSYPASFKDFFRRSNF